MFFEPVAGSFVRLAGMLCVLMCLQELLAGIPFQSDYRVSVDLEIGPHPILKDLASVAGLIFGGLHFGKVDRSRQFLFHKK